MLANLADCRFSYWDGVIWQDYWDKIGQLPQMVKITFRLSDEEREEEFIVNIPVGP